MKARYLGYLFALLAVLFWAPNSAVSKLLIGNLDILQILFFTTLFAVIILLIAVVSQKKLHVLMEYKPKDYLNLAVIGFIGIFLSYLFFLASIKFLPAQETMVLFYFFPIPTAILGFFLLKERIGLKGLFAIIISFLGAIVVISKGDIFALQFASLAGVLLGFGAAVSHAVFSILDKKHNYERFTATLIYFASSLVFSFAALLMFSSIPALSTGQLLGLICVGAMVGGLGYTFWLLALKHGDTAMVSNIVLLTPFASLILINLLVKEEIALSSIIGLILMLAGILIQSTRK